jgi:hypothetical protein
VNGHAYDVPAAIADINLPVDTSLQNSFTITSSSWSSSTTTCSLNGAPTTLATAPCEILTVSMATINNGSAGHIMGRFTPPAWNAACTPAGLVNGEIYIVNSTTTQIAYALSSNPLTTCTGVMKFPNIRQFDENIYQADSGPNPLNPGPSPAIFAYGGSNEETQPSGNRSNRH